MRVAIITSTDPQIELEPFVVVEDDNGVVVQYSKNKEDDKQENDHYLDIRKSFKNKMNLENALHGYSYFDVEIVEYKGKEKVRVDSLLVSFGYKEML